MFGSDILDVAIGLVLTYFFISVAASSIVEAVSTLTKKRANDLSTGITRMLGSGDSIGLPALRSSSVLAPVGNNASYLSAKAFSEAVIELIRKARAAEDDLNELVLQLPDPLKTRLQMIVEDVGVDLTAIKAELETWFDEMMSELEELYKKWTLKLVFGVGLALSLVLNASTFRIATELYRNSTIRGAVVASASSTSQGSLSEIAKDVDTFSSALSTMQSLSLPLGWNNVSANLGEILWLLIGIVFTSFLVMLGAPFWFDLLGKLVSIRGSGQKPPTAREDPASATTRRLIREFDPFSPGLGIMAARAIIEADEDGPPEESVATVDPENRWAIALSAALDA